MIRHGDRLLVRVRQAAALQVLSTLWFRNTWTWWPDAATSLPASGGDARTGATELLERHGCWEPLWRVEAPASGYDPEGAAPFTHGLPVFSR